MTKHEELALLMARDMCKEKNYQPICSMCRADMECEGNRFVKEARRLATEIVGEPVIPNWKAITYNLS